jgi:hypothetical protein
MFEGALKLWFPLCDVPRSASVRRARCVGRELEELKALELGEERFESRRLLAVHVRREVAILDV